LERFHLARAGYPDTLQALTPEYIAAVPNDIVSAAPYRYQRLGNGRYLLYSVGWDETDDQGREAEQRDQGDWVWRYPD